LSNDIYNYDLGIRHV